MCITDSPWCTPETNTRLQIKFTTIKIFLKIAQIGMTSQFVCIAHKLLEAPIFLIMDTNLS